MSVYPIEANQLRITRILGVKTSSPTVKTFVFEDKRCLKARPGQFLMLWIPGVDEIPLSILGASDNGTVSVTVKNVGEATDALHRKKTGDLVGLRGPFGNSFTVNGRKLLMVGGGTGAVPLLFLCRRLVSKGPVTTFVLGAKTKDELLFMNQLEKLKAGGTRLITSTEDGSCGVTGLCTETVEELLLRQKFDMVYACGPERMIAKVFELAEKNGLPFQASLERLMRCAMGLCGSCAVGHYRVCADGPVFTSKQLRKVRDEFGVSKRDRFGKKVTID